MLCIKPFTVYTILFDQYQHVYKLHLEDITTLQYNTSDVAHLYNTTAIFINVLCNLCLFYTAMFVLQIDWVNSH